MNSLATRPYIYRHCFSFAYHICSEAFIHGVEVLSLKIKSPFFPSLFLSSTIDLFYRILLSTSGELARKETRLKIHGGRPYGYRRGPADIFFPNTRLRARKRREGWPEATGSGYSGSLNRFLRPASGLTRRCHGRFSGPKRPKNRQRRRPER